MISKPATERTCRWAMPMAVSWLLTVSMVERKVRKPHCAARVLGALLFLCRGTSTPPPVARMTASSEALLSPLSP